MTQKKPIDRLQTIQHAKGVQSWRSLVVVAITLFLLGVPSASAAPLEGGPSWRYEPAYSVQDVAVATGAVILSETPHPLSDQSEGVFKLRGLDPETGEVLWVREDDVDAFEIEPIGSNVLVLEKGLHDSAITRAVLRDPVTGVAKWSTVIDSPDISHNIRPIDDFDRVWIALKYDRYQALSTSTGQPIGGPVSSLLPYHAGDHLGGIVVSGTHVYNRFTNEALTLAGVLPVTVVGSGPFEGLVTGKLMNGGVVPWWTVPTVSTRIPGSSDVRTGYLNGFEFDDVEGGESGLVGWSHGGDLTGALYGFGPGPNCHVPGPYRRDVNEPLHLDLSELCTGVVTTVGPAIKSWGPASALFDGANVTLDAAQPGVATVIVEVAGERGDSTLVQIVARFGIDITGCEYTNVDRRAADGALTANFGCDNTPPGTVFTVSDSRGDTVIGNGGEVVYVPSEDETGERTILVSVDGVDPQVFEHDRLEFTLGPAGFCLKEVNLKLVHDFVSFVPRCFGEHQLALSRATSAVGGALDVDVAGDVVEISPLNWENTEEWYEVDFVMEDEFDSAVNGIGIVRIDRHAGPCAAWTTAVVLSSDPVSTSVTCEGVRILEVDDATGYPGYVELHDVSNDETSLTVTTSANWNRSMGLWPAYRVTYETPRGYIGYQTVRFRFDIVPVAPICTDGRSRANRVGQTVILTPVCSQSVGVSVVTREGVVSRCVRDKVGCPYLSHAVTGVIGTYRIAYKVLDDLAVPSEHTWSIVVGPTRGADNLIGSMRSDTVNLGEGDDRFNSRDSRRDYVFCGAGYDTVWADHRDVVGNGCERVRRASWELSG